MSITIAELPPEHICEMMPFLSLGEIRNFQLTCRQIHAAIALGQGSSQFVERKCAFLEDKVGCLTQEFEVAKSTLSVAYMAMQRFRARTVRKEVNIAQLLAHRPIMNRFLPQDSTEAYNASEKYRRAHAVACSREKQVKVAELQLAAALLQKAR